MDKRVINFVDLILNAPTIFPASEVSGQGLLSESDEGGRTRGESLVNPAKRNSNLETIDEK